MQVQRNGDVLRSGAPLVVGHCFPVRRCMLPRLSVTLRVGDGKGRVAFLRRNVTITIPCVL